MLREGETLLSILQAVEYLTSVGYRTAKGKPIRRETLYDWRNAGLECGHAGGRLVTSREAIWRFLNREQSPSPSPLSATLRRQDAAAERELEEAGW